MYIDKTGNRWYKGNLHTHTTVSDGKFSPAETKAIYAEAGYDFIALTDHWKYGGNIADDPSGMLVLSGTEYNFNGDDVLAGVFHVVGVGMDSDPLESISRESNAQEAIDEILRRGGAAVYAHPAWSLNTWDMLVKFKNISAVEIFNSASDIPKNCRPYSGDIIDQLAARGFVHKLAATDDTHFYLGEETLSYIMVNLGKKPLNRENVVSAILNGDFYATQGPNFRAFVENDEFVVECDESDDIERVVFFTNLPWENLRTVQRSNCSSNCCCKPVTVARFPIKAKHTFVRAEIVGSNGKTGWSQISVLNG